MKQFTLVIDENNKLDVCGIEQSAVDWEISKGKNPIGKIETDLSILELKDFIGG